METSRNPLVRLLAHFAARLRFPHLFFLTAALFLLDLLIPDTIPFADEILLALATLLLGSLRRRKDEGGDLSVASTPRRSA